MKRVVARLAGAFLSLVLAHPASAQLIPEWDGSVIWTSQYDAGNCPERANAFTTDAAGNIYVTGITWPPGLDHQEGFYTYKMDSAGNVLWTAAYDGLGQSMFGDDIAVDIALDANGDVLVTGPSNDGGGSPDFATIKYRGTDGAQLWLARLDPDGDRGNLNENVVTMRRRAADGVRQWLSIFGGLDSNLRSDRVRAESCTGARPLWFRCAQPM